MSMRMAPLSAVLLAVSVSVVTAQPDEGSPDRTAVAVEALKRLQGVDLEKNPKVTIIYENEVVEVLGENEVEAVRLANPFKGTRDSSVTLRSDPPLATPDGDTVVN